MRVGELARRAGVTLRALRYYEKAGLVMPTRLPNGYREYDPVAVRQVERIRELTSLGLSVAQTRPFVECLAEGHDSGDECPSSLAAYRRAIADLDERMARLARCRDGLARHLEAAAGRAVPSAATRSRQGAAGSVRRRSPSGDGSRISRLVGSRMPAVRLPATDGSSVDLRTLGPGRTVFYVYPLTGRPGVDLPEGWESIPGAQGCTAEACGFRDHHDELREAGAARVFGLSTQAEDYQRELVGRLRLPFAMLADPGLDMCVGLGLPTFDAGGTTMYERLTMIVYDGVVEHVFYPVSSPDRHARQVLDWLRDGRSRGR
ncbi:MerR family transcriptional regulator [Polymorphospora rubra]|uniref:MerR family transcriptional regulator n=1 Tax=Polymorphospora rubra TaxID=338584 RepID=UPI001BB400E9|nr:MerR family transcriptional regulator [Polymorphospora rubra]